MGLLKKASQAQKESQTAKRIATLPTPELAPWVEQCLYRIGKDLVDYAHEGEPAFVLDALREAELTVEILQEFRRRVAP